MGANYQPYKGVPVAQGSCDLARQGRDEGFHFFQTIQSGI